MPTMGAQSGHAAKNCSFGYIDEAGTSQRFFGCGLLMHGPFVSGKDDQDLNEHIRKLKMKAGIKLRGDVCWKKAPKKGQYLNLYLRYLEGFFRHPLLSFNVIVVDTHKYPINSKEFFRGSKDVGIDAFAFHLIKRRISQFWHKDTKIHIRFDRRSRPVDVHLAKLSARLRNCRSECDGIINARSVTGGRHPLLQVTDLLLGCVIGPCNTELKHEGKLQLFEYLRTQLGRDPREATKPSEQKFNVWYFEPK